MKVRTSFSGALRGLSCVSTLLLATACFYGDPPTSLIIENESDSGVTALINRDGGSQGSTDETPALTTGHVSWPRCDTKWVILNRQSDGQEFYRANLELCPGDTLAIGSDFSVTTRCDKESLEVRSEQC